MMQELDLKGDENANTVTENMNVISPKKDLNSTKSARLPEKDTKIQAKNSINETKSSVETSSRKAEHEYKINDDSVDLKPKTADERANRRAKRQERMARLAKEQTEDEKKEAAAKVLAEKGLSGGKDTEKSQSKDDKKLERDGGRSGVNDFGESRRGGRNEDKSNSDSMIDNKKTGKYSERSTANSFSDTRRGRRDEEQEEEKPSRYESKRNAEKSSSKTPPDEKPLDVKRTESQLDKKSSSRLGKFETKVETVKKTQVDAPKSFVEKTEKKEERTFIQGGQKYGGARQTIEEKTVVENGEKTTVSTRTNSRLSNSMEKFGGSGRIQVNSVQSDKTRAAKAVGNALSVGRIRDKFATAEKV